MKRVIEIRAAEGGEDSKLFVKDLADAYQRLAGKLGWTTRLLDVRLGECSIEVQGDDLTGLYNEPGGHRIQRIPPTEKKGRVHTSTVTVAVIDPAIVQTIVRWSAGQDLATNIFSWAVFSDGASVGRNYSTNESTILIGVA